MRSSGAFLLFFVGVLPYLLFLFSRFLRFLFVAFKAAFKIGRNWIDKKVSGIYNRKERNLSLPFKGRARIFGEAAPFGVFASSPYFFIVRRKL